MKTQFDELTKELTRYFGEIGAGLPEVMGGFSSLSKAATTDRVLATKTKELMEVPGVCIYMGGSPSLMYAADAVRAFDEFSELPPTR